MKRGAPLKRSPMPRSTKPLQSKTELRRTGRLKPRSARMTKLYVEERVPLVIEMLEVGGPYRCEFPLGCSRIADTVHEYFSRGQGGKVVGPENVYFRSCTFHNGYAEDHINESHDIGWRYCKKRAAYLAVEAAA